MQISTLPNPEAPVVGDTYDTSIGRIVVCSIAPDGMTFYYRNGDQRGSAHFALMLRSITSVTPICQDARTASGD